MSTTQRSTSCISIPKYETGGRCAALPRLEMAPLASPLALFCEHERFRTINHAVTPATAAAATAPYMLAFEDAMIAVC